MVVGGGGVVGRSAFGQESVGKRVRMQISAKSSGELRGFWRGLPPVDASTKPSLWSAWRGTWFDNERSVSQRFAAGKKRWVTIDLRSNANYKGAICGLGVDIPAHGYIHKIQVQK